MRGSLIWAIAAAALGCGASSYEGTLSVCGAGAAQPVGPAPTGPRATRNVIVVTLDGVRWQEMFGGSDLSLAQQQHLPRCSWLTARELVPNIYRRFVDGGAVVGAPGHGATIDASGPTFVSLPGYEELFLGRPGRGCSDNECGPVVQPTLVDELRARFPEAGAVAIISSWERIDRVAAAHPSMVVMSAGRRRGPTRDRVAVTAAARAILDEAAHVRTWPGHHDYRPDRYTAALALEYLAAQRPRFLFIGLGDADEHAHANDYRRYLGSLRDGDAFIAALFRTLEALGRYGQETTVILTVDHGRDENFAEHGYSPVSGRVWLMAAGGAVPRRGFVSASAQHRLTDLAPTVRALLDLSPDLAVDAGRPIDELLPSAMALDRSRVDTPEARSRRSE
jgi:hypothetical protein